MPAARRRFLRLGQYRRDRVPAAEVQRVLLEEAGVAGIAGQRLAEGENYLRFSLVSATHLLEEALERMERVAKRWGKVAAAR